MLRALKNWEAQVCRNAKTQLFVNSRVGDTDYELMLPEFLQKVDNMMKKAQPFLSQEFP